jgi:transmembrane sensor
VTSDYPPNERRPWRTDDEWDRLRERIEGAELSRARRPRGRWPVAAAAVLVIAATSAIVWQNAHLKREAPRMATTAAGERIVLHLADSSVVTLGPASSLRYQITGRSREITLDGLADFNVVHDGSRPFVVHAKNAVATDVGTRFVVRAYASDETVQVAVTDGVVSLGGSDTTRIELRAGDVGRVGASGRVARDANQVAATRAAWVEGRLVFDDEPLSNVAAELSRWFDVDIRIAGSTLGKRSVSAVYNNPSLSGVMDALQATHGLRVERVGRTITISERVR